MRVLIDTNVILDFLLEREPFFQDAEELFLAIGNGQIEGYVSATTITDVFYIARRHTQNLEQARQVVLITIATLNICPVNLITLNTALASNLRDFEDAVQVACAIAQGLNAIITRNTQDFVNSTIPPLSVRQLIEQLANF